MGHALRTPRLRAATKLTLLLTAATVVAASTAWAVPMQLAHQGRLLDADSVPLDGSHTLGFALYDAELDGTVIWSEDVEALMTGGFYSVVLGVDEADNPLDDLVLGGGPLWLELRVDSGEPLEPRHQLLSVPYAVMAGTATNVEGGYVDATEVAIDGDLVIDGDGNWVGPTPSVDWADLSGVPEALDTLGGLSCSDGGVAKFDGDAGLWACATDLVLTTADVLAIVAGSTLDLGIGSSVDGGVIATLDDLDWSMLTGIPAGLADEEDADTLAALGLVCADGDRAAWDSVLGDWVCASEEVALDRLDTAVASGGQVLTFDGTNVAWEDPASTTSPPCTLTTLNEPSSYAEVACGATAVFLRTWMSFTQVSGGFDHSCGIDSTGAVQCWGYNNHGQSTPPSDTFTQVSAGWHHTCGIDSSGSVQCWGSDIYGQSTPLAGTFAQVSGGQSHTCGIDSSGSVQCWGHDYYGQSTPPSGTFTQVSGGQYHTCGIDSTGSVQCWGRDDYGESTPPAGTFTQVSAGYRYTCGIDSSGSVQCWGYDNYGQSTPPSGTFTQVSAGGEHTCGIDSTGSVQCWGYDAYGQATPPAGTFTQISASSSHTCGLRQTVGPVACWGHDWYSQSSPP